MKDPTMSIIGLVVVSCVILAIIIPILYKERNDVHIRPQNVQRRTSRRTK